MTFNIALSQMPQSHARRYSPSLLRWRDCGDAATMYVFVVVAFWVVVQQHNNVGFLFAYNTRSSSSSYHQAPCGVLHPFQKNSETLVYSRATTVWKAVPLDEHVDDPFSTESLSSSLSSSSFLSERPQRRRSNTRNAPSIPCCRIIACASTTELADAVTRYVQPGDHVAELGSQLRLVSTNICQAVMVRCMPKADDTYKSVDNEKEEEGDREEFKRTTTTTVVTGGGGRVVLVDVIRKAPQNMEESQTRAMRRPGEEHDFFPDVATFREIPHLDDWRSALWQWKDPTDRYDDSLTISSSLVPCYDVFVLHVNAIVGNDLEWTALTIIREFMAHQPECRVVQVKSTSLTCRASQLIHGQKWIATRQKQQQQQRDSEPNDDCGASSTHDVSARGNETSSRKATPSGSGTTRPPTTLIGTVGVQQYRETIPYTVRAGDRVMEIGCHLGTTTAILFEYATGRKRQNSLVDNEREGTIRRADHTTNEMPVTCVMGVDVGPKIIKSAQQQYPHIHFAVGDAWKTAQLLRLQREYYATRSSTVSSSVVLEEGFDVLYVDVGGLSGADGLMEALSLLSVLQWALEPRCIVIKSLCIRRLASTLVPYWQVQEEGTTRNAS